MMHKIPIHHDRIRTTPSQFSWVDHRLVRDRHLERLSHEAAALYLFLVTVADCQGLSYYSDASVCQHLTLEAPALAAARVCLRNAGLVAYRKPLYQVLALGDVPAPATSPTRRSAGEPMALTEIFNKLAGGTP
jgi:hypothetical protein